MFVLAFAGCQREDRAALASGGDASKAAVDPAFAQAQQAWRDARRARLASPDG